MAPEQIFNKVKEILKTDARLSYMKEIYEGERPANYRGTFPNITLEILSNITEEVLENNQRLCIFRMMITGAILITDFNKQIIGDEIQKGILDVEKDIKEVLYSKFPDLDGNCLYFVLSTNSYSMLESANGRAVFIQGDFYYKEK